MKWKSEKRIIHEAEYVSGQWHMMKGPLGICISHDDLLCSPVGFGKSEKEAFENMLRKFEDYKKKLETVKPEIEARLAELEQGK